MLIRSGSYRQPGGQPRPLHLTPGAMAQVVVGGVFGAAAREAVEQALPTATDAFPAATLAVNISGALLLGILIEALLRAGDDSGARRRARLVLGTGFMGAYTTYSALAVEADLLVRAGRPLSAALYVLATLGGGLAAAAGGIALAAIGGRHRTAELPIDPDVDVGGAQQ